MPLIMRAYRPYRYRVRCQALLGGNPPCREASRGMPPLGGFTTSGEAGCDVFGVALIRGHASGPHRRPAVRHKVSRL